MRLYSSPGPGGKGEGGGKRTPEVQRELVTPKTTITPIILKQEIESESGGQDG